MDGKKTKRRVVLHGPSTMTVSLPSLWAKKFNLKKGDYLNVEEFGNELKIFAHAEPELKKHTHNVSNLSRTGKAYVTAAYRRGFDEIFLSYDDSTYIKEIRELISKELMGFELIKQESNSCIIKDITGSKKDEFEIALKRIWVLLLDISKESQRALTKKNRNELETIATMDFAMNKFTNYCLRILTKHGHDDFRKTSVYYHLIKNLEEMADFYKDLCMFFSTNTSEIDSILLSSLSNINEDLEALCEIFFRYDDKSVESLYQKTKETFSNLKLNNPTANSYLFSISKNIRNLISVVVESKL